MTQTSLIEAPLMERRFLQLDATPAADAAEFTASLSSREPVERFDYIEILEHTADAVSLRRAREGLPLLLNHDPALQVGRVQNVRIEGERLRGVLRFGNGALAREVLADVRDGIRREISIGYEVQKTRRGSGREVHVIRWEPVEVSIVAIAADPTVGIGRNKDMNFMNTTDPGTLPETRPDSGPEARRRTEIMDLAALAGEREIGVDAVLRGLSVEDFRAGLLQRRHGSSRPIAASLDLSQDGPRAGALRAFGREVELPTNFGGGVATMRDGSRLPILSRGDRVADLLGKDPSHDEARELGFAGFLRAIVEGPKTPLEKRVLGGAAIGTGGAMVPTPLAADVIDRLRSLSVAFQAGANIVEMNTASLRMARVTGDPTGTWRAENAAINESDPAFDQVTLTAKSWGVLTRVSRELLGDAMNMEGQLRDLFARTAAVALDQAILMGSGTSNQPLGIAGTSGIQTVSMGTNGAQLTNWSPMLNAVQSLEAANAGAVEGMIMAPRTARAIYGFTDTTNQPLQPPPRLASVPSLVTTSMPITETQGTSVNASSILMGDFREVIVGMRWNLEITAHPDRYADSGQVAFIAFMRADVTIGRPAAMARIQGIIP